MTASRSRLPIRFFFLPSRSCKTACCSCAFFYLAVLFAARFVCLRLVASAASVCCPKARLRAFFNALAEGFAVSTSFVARSFARVLGSVMFSYVLLLRL